MRDDLMQQIAYWKKSSAEDFAAAKSLLAHRLYPQSLFFCHLAVEKLLKGIVAKRTGEPAPYLHDLLRLAKIAGIQCTEDQQTILDELSTLNVAGRYPSEKLAFHKMHNTRGLAERYVSLRRQHSYGSPTSSKKSPERHSWVYKATSSGRAHPN